MPDGPDKTLTHLPGSGSVPRDETVHRQWLCVMPSPENIVVSALQAMTTVLLVSDGHNAVATGGFFPRAVTDLLLKTVQPRDFLHGYGSPWIFTDFIQVGEALRAWSQHPASMISGTLFARVR